MKFADLKLLLERQAQERQAAEQHARDTDPDCQPDPEVAELQTELTALRASLREALEALEAFEHMTSNLIGDIISGRALHGPRMLDGLTSLREKARKALSATAPKPNE